MISEIEVICDDVVILNLGQVVARGSVAEVIGRAEHNIVLRNSIRLRFPSQFVDKARQLLKEMPVVKQVAPFGEMEDWLQVELDPAGSGEASKA
jgi:ABC-type uncharacterized transport system ATPase subunit